MKKVVLSGIALVMVAALGAGLWLYSSLDELAKAALEKHVPEVIEAPVKVGSVKISPTDGAGAITGLRIGNPKGFKTEHALAAASIELAVDPASLTGGTLVIRKIAVAAPDIHYETSDAGSNFDVIQANANAFVKRHFGESRKDPKDAGRKMIVEHLSIHDAKVSYAPAILQGKSITVPMPNIDLRNLGRAKGGVTAGELSAEIIGALKAQVMNAVTRPIKGVTDAVGNAAKGVGDTVKGLFK